jgi:hypothetical protein
VSDFGVENRAESQRPFRGENQSEPPLSSRHSAQGFNLGFNPGNRHPERRALKGRQIERPNSAKVESKLYRFSACSELEYV